MAQKEWEAPQPSLEVRMRPWGKWIKQGILTLRNRVLAMEVVIELMLRHLLRHQLLRILFSRINNSLEEEYLQWYSISAIMEIPIQDMISHETLHQARRERNYNQAKSGLILQLQLERLDHLHSPEISTTLVFQEDKYSNSSNSKNYCQKKATNWINIFNMVTKT